MNPRYELELFIGRLCSLTDRVDPADVLERIGTLRHELVSGEWSDSGASAAEVKKKTPDAGPADRGVSPPPSPEAEAEKFFSSFKSGGPPPAFQAAETVPTREDTGEPDCAVPVDIGTGGLTGHQPPEEEDFGTAPAIATAAPETPEVVSPSPDQPSSVVSAAPEQALDQARKKELVLTQMKRSNLTLAAALEKARAWQWNGNALLLTFDSSYEATLVKNEAETLRRIAAEAGVGPFTVDTRTEKTETASEGTESPRVALVRQVFRGQVMKG